MIPIELPWSPPEIIELRRALREYFGAQARRLPWRQTDDPWAILVSEVMLQQTRVDTVVPYYRRWMAQFPTPAAMAAADETAVLTLWQGLGYYSRARNLHRTAKALMAQHDGRLPASLESLRALPGVGPYTAGAVASIAFGIPAAAVDGNVRRVFARLLDLPDPSLKDLDKAISGVVDPETPGTFNQALMELGATLCTPRTPDCPRCPVRGHCQALAHKTVATRPLPKRRAPVPHDTEVVVVIVRDPGTAKADTPAEVGLRHWLVRRRPDSGLLAAMWEFPGVVLSEPASNPHIDAVAAAETRALLAQAGFALVDLAPVNSREAIPPPSTLRSLGQLRPLPHVEHVFTHLRRRYVPYMLEGVTLAPVPDATRVADQPGPPAGGLQWVAEPALAGLPFPVAQQKIFRAAQGVQAAHAAEIE